MSRLASDLTPAALGYSPCRSRMLGSARKQIAWKNLVVISENLSSRDLCDSVQKSHGTGSFKNSCEIHL